MHKESKARNGAIDFSGRKVRGTTLVELMVSVTLFSLMSIVLLVGLTQAYRLSSLVRYQDQARFILTTVSDQFLRAGYRLSDNSIRTFFVETGNTPTGTGMGWDPALNMFAFPPLAAITGDPLMVPLGQANQTVGVTATVTRKVQMVNPTNGSTVGAVMTSAGFMLRGDFTITFPFMGRDYTQTTTVLRVMPQKP